jgi:outer membrane protein OmpA-like peptidoglycan-associated protein
VSKLGILRMYAALCLLAAPGLAGCGTVAGFGQDVAATGRFIENGAKSTQEAMFGRSAEASETAEMSSPEGAAPSAGANVIYFDSGSADLNAEGRDMIRALAIEAKKRGAAKIEVSGYADTSGAPNYNRQLSQRRASVVAAALEAQGLPSESIDVNWYGESDLAMPTHDGVASAGNRRVVMDISSG